MPTLLGAAEANRAGVADQPTGGTVVDVNGVEAPVGKDDPSGEPSATPPRDRAKEEHLYHKERRKYVDGEAQACSTFDKYVFPVAAAALGLSLTFIKDVIGSEEPVWVWSIVVAWLAFAAALISTMLSFRLSAAAFSRECNIIEEAYRTEGTVKDAAGKNRSRTAVRVVNWVSFGSMTAGIAFLILFVANNF